MCLSICIAGTFDINFSIANIHHQLHELKEFDHAKRQSPLDEQGEDKDDDDGVKLSSYSLPLSIGLSSIVYDYRLWHTSMESHA